VEQGTGGELNLELAKEPAGSIGVSVKSADLCETCCETVRGIIAKRFRIAGSNEAVFFIPLAAKPTPAAKPPVAPKPSE
jgi:hypothetical protein